MEIHYCDYCASTSKQIQFVTEKLCIACYELGLHITRGTENNRKRYPITTGCLDYFPDALLTVAECSLVCNEQHHPGESLYWDKNKSTDEADALVRHLIQRGTLDEDGIKHTAKVAWRALALLQREIEKEKQ